jgi:hypothetical protein
MIDVFISHASEDKTDFVRPLADYLLSMGITVWYDEYSLSIGDSLVEKIEEGLSGCTFGVVILSKSFFLKKWPRRELNALSTIEIERGKTILPLWHNISYNEVLTFSPTLADKVAVITSVGIDKIGRRIHQEVMKKQKPLLTYDDKEKINAALSLGWGLGYIELFADNLEVLSDYEQEIIKIYVNNVTDIVNKENISFPYNSWKQYVDRLVVEYKLRDLVRHSFVLMGIGASRLDMAKRMPDGEHQDQMMNLARSGSLERIDDSIIKRPELIYHDMLYRTIPHPAELERYVRFLSEEST